MHLLLCAWPAQVLGYGEVFARDGIKECDCWSGAIRAGVPDVERAIHHLVCVVLRGVLPGASCTQLSARVALEPAPTLHYSSAHR